mmetsp:Transcript_13887/g.28411  ORF Transcript_13887/g.28411 Transcript_13887/m.28411 type:complete len:244 (+) Transcript_13887:39-770(+)
MRHLLWYFCLLLIFQTSQSLLAPTSVLTRPISKNTEIPLAASEIRGDGQEHAEVEVKIEAVQSTQFNHPFRSYSKFVARRPFASNLLQGFILFGLSDVIAQLMFGPAVPVPFSLPRAWNAAVFGGFYSGVLISQWILLLDRWLPGSGLGWRTGTKVAANAFIFGLVGNSCNVFFRNFLSPGSTLSSARHHVKKVMWTVFWADMKVFPPADAICFAFVPPHLRPAFTGIVSLCWNTYVSLVANH